MKYEIKVDGKKFDVEVKDDTRKGTERCFKVDVSGKEFEIAVKTESAPRSAAPVFTVSTPVPMASFPTASTTQQNSVHNGAEPIAVPSPMAGKIVKIVVSEGDKIKEGDVLIILEAMKMENSIIAPADGSIDSISVSVGDVMQKGNTLCTIKAGG